jgi:CRISPR/Cas system endoribonuclease Cas6 (RAMP superfamily)
MLVAEIMTIAPETSSHQVGFHSLSPIVIVLSVKDSNQRSELGGHSICDKAKRDISKGFNQY